MKQFFVTGTDTGVGKTIIAAILTKIFNAYYWKPIQSGYDQASMVDADYVSNIIQDHQRIVPSRYQFKESLSPDQAARLENITMNLADFNFEFITAHLKHMQASSNFYTETPIIIEGAGGVLVPINNDTFMLDLIKKFNLPVIVVTRGTLGTINHTLLTLSHLRQHQINIKGVVFSGELNIRNQNAIEKFGKVKTLFHFPFFDNLSAEKVSAWINMNKEAILKNFEMMHEKVN